MSDFSVADMMTGHCPDPKDESAWRAAGELVALVAAGKRPRAAELRAGGLHIDGAAYDQAAAVTIGDVMLAATAGGAAVRFLRLGKSKSAMSAQAAELCDSIEDEGARENARRAGGFIGQYADAIEWAAERFAKGLPVGAVGISARMMRYSETAEGF